MPLAIEDYALIGDCHTAALVGRDGSIDWLCLPRFDAPACFAALLGAPEHGRWLVAPRDSIRRVSQRYRPGTLILETEFETADGVVVLIDFMPPRSREPDLVHTVRGVRGRAKMHTETHSAIRLWVDRPLGAESRDGTGSRWRSGLALRRFADRAQGREPAHSRGFRSHRRRRDQLRADVAVLASQAARIA
jgi:GH15 family glucan-1,4-alpha-glucosidase